MGGAMSISSIDYIRCERDPKTLWFRVRLQITENMKEVAGEAARRITNQQLSLTQAESFAQENLQHHTLLKRQTLEEIWAKYAVSSAEFMTRAEFKSMIQEYLKASREHAMNEVQYTVETILTSSNMSREEVVSFQDDATVREETINKASAMEKTFSQWILESDEKAEQMFLKLTTGELVPKKAFVERWANVLEEVFPTISFKYTMLRTYAVGRLLSANKTFKAEEGTAMREKVTPGRDAQLALESIELK